MLGLERLFRRGEVYLIVHEDELDEKIRGGGTPEYLDKLRRAKQEITRVSGLPNSIAITHNFPDQIKHDIGRAARVTVMGVNREACIKWVSEAAQKAGAEVTISDEGTA